MDGVHCGSSLDRSFTQQSPSVHRWTLLRQPRTDSTARHAASGHANMKSRHPEDTGFVRQQR